ncbi:MAG: alkaline phosphatase family protein, partial [Woeseiaceae bacterium]
PDDWMEHDESIPGSGDIWIAIMGPDTLPRGELSDAPLVYQADVAATVLTLFGLDPADFSAEAGPPIAAAFGPAR